MTDAYKQVGVDIDKGNAFVEAIKPAIRKTHRPEVLSSLGHFAGLFELDLKKYKQPILVSATDGVGTKLKLAQAMNQYDTIGQDLVAMNANDLICLGAEPLFFLDYFATGSLDVAVAKEVIEGIAKACEEIHCSLIGGETAEMPSIYSKGDFDLAGFVVGVVEKGKICDGSKIEPGQKVIGLPSSGFHSNGYSLVRHVVDQHKLDLNLVLPGCQKSLGTHLLRPTELYVNSVLDAYAHHTICGMAHITGGGLLENIPRILPKNCRITLHKDTWEIPPFMKFISDKGGVSQEEQYKVFNCGIGFVLIVPQKESDILLKRLQKFHPKAAVIGDVVSRKEGKGAIEIL